MVVHFKKTDSNMSNNASADKFRRFQRETLKHALHVKEFNRVLLKTLFSPLHIFGNYVYVTHVSFMDFAGYFNIAVKRA